MAEIRSLDTKYIRCLDVFFSRSKIGTLYCRVAVRHVVLCMPVCDDLMHILSTVYHLLTYQVLFQWSWIAMMLHCTYTV